MTVPIQHRARPMTIPEHLRFPRTVEDMTPLWLTTVLTRSGLLSDGQRVVALRHEEAAGGIAVTGCVTRLSFDVEPDRPSVPKGLFAKLRNPAWRGDPQEYVLEIRFYRDLASRLNLAVPRCYHADVDEDSGDFVLLLEDLTGATPGHPLEGCTFEQSLLLMTELGRLHGTWWGGKELANMGWPERTYDAARLEKRLAQFRTEWRPFTEDRRYRVDEGLLQAVERTSDTLLMDSARQLAEPPVTLVHGDLHVENLLLDDRAGELQAWLFDWQDVALGHPARDFSYMLAGNTAVDVQRERGDELLRAYLTVLRESAAVDYDFDKLIADHVAAVRWEFVYHVIFLRQFEPETAHDLRTLQLEWERLAAAFCAC